MKAPLQIGITGGIGSGKSLVSHIFVCLGTAVYDADRAAKDVMTHDATLVAQLKNEFGEQAYDSEGRLNRQYLARAVFGVPEKTEALNRMVHPRVHQHYAEWLTHQEGKPYVLKEAALLFEAGTFADLDKIIVVSAPSALRLQRVLARDPQRSEEEVLKIMKSQLDENEKIKRADFIIVNDGTRLIIPQVLELHRRFLTADQDS
jgi:dephospho-CoA kinase